MNPQNQNHSWSFGNFTEKEKARPYIKTGPFFESISETTAYSNVPKCLIVLTIWLV